MTLLSKKEKKKKKTKKAIGLFYIMQTIFSFCYIFHKIIIVMFRQIILLTIVVASCVSQEHLTCLRTDDVINLPPTPQNSTRNQQGSPGKRGPIGAKGSIGQKGSKGDTGVPDNSMIDSLRDEFMVLRQQVQNISVLSTAYYRGYKLLDDGWVALFNGYQYKITPSRQSWQSSRTICKNLGGDLAVYGVQNMEYRRILLEVFSGSTDYYWIGLNDIASEGNWFWINGVSASATVFWALGQPDNAGGREDCAEIRRTEAWRFSTNDNVCENSDFGLCEKVLTTN